MKISELRAAIEVGLAASGIEGEAAQQISNTILVAIKMRESMQPAQAPAPAAEAPATISKIPVPPDLRPGLAIATTPPPDVHQDRLVVLAESLDDLKAKAEVARATEGVVVNRVNRDPKKRGKIDATEFFSALMNLPETVTIQGHGSPHLRDLTRSIQQTNQQQLVQGQMVDLIFYQVVYYLSDQAEDLAVRIHFCPDDAGLFDRPDLDNVILEVKDRGAHNFRRRDRVIETRRPEGPSMMDPRGWVSVQLQNK